jgi:hypothetical protein
MSASWRSFVTRSRDAGIYEGFDEVQLDQVTKSISM